MRRSSEPWPIYTVNTRKADINPKPPYQRGIVWSKSQKQLFVDSILRGFDIPKLYLRTTTDQSYQWEIVDGQQRLRAIWEFLQGEYSVSDEADPVEGRQIAGRFFDDLSVRDKDRFTSYPLSIVEFGEATDQEIEEMFIRLQNGVPLNSAEKRHAISGKVRDFINSLASKHRLMTDSVYIPRRRYSHDEVVAQMLLVELHKGPTKVRHEQLRRMYIEKRKTFSKTSAEASKVKKVMNFLAKAFPEKSPYLTKVNLLSLYLVVSEAIGKYSLSQRTEDFRRWFIGFERRRKENEDKPEDEISEEMASYQQAVQQQTADLPSQETRRNILLKDLLVGIPNLKLLDDQRLFTHEQRLAIFDRAEGQCANPVNILDCEAEPGWDNFHADHIIPYAEGGPTTVANGQLLCPNCNQKKSNKTA